jgi:hypothetical protein
MMMCGNQAGVYWRKEIFSISVAPAALVLPKNSFLWYTSATNEKPDVAA